MFVLLDKETHAVSMICPDKLSDEFIDVTGQDMPENFAEYTVIDGKIVSLAALFPEASLAEAKRAAIKTVHDAQNNFLVAYKEQYPAIEVDSFDSKRKEAEAWMLDNATPTPTIDKLVNPPETKQDLVNAILAKVNILAEIERQTTAYRTAVKACATSDDVAAVPLPGFITASQGQG